jgi:2-hydroxy-6-oxonona-2,4-dienedioate hydrolase
MTRTTQPPSTSSSLSLEARIEDLEARAQRVETPCGDGTVVWRSWGAGQPLLLLHGAHGSWMHWIRNIDALSEVGRVLIPDLPGYGDSALPPVDDKVESHAEALARGLEHLDPGLPVDLVGFSMGALLGAHLAVLAPQLVRRFIIVDAGGLGTPMPQLPLRSLRDVPERAKHEVHRTNLLLIMIHDPANVDDLALHIQAHGVRRARSKLHFQLMPDKLLQALPHVRAPIDLIWAEHDRPHPDPLLHQAVLRQFQPETELRTVQGAGHWCMYERPAAFNEAIRDLLGTTTRGADLWSGGSAGIKPGSVRGRKPSEECDI